MVISTAFVSTVRVITVYEKVKRFLKATFPQLCILVSIFAQSNWLFRLEFDYHLYQLFTTSCNNRASKASSSRNVPTTSSTNSCQKPPSKHSSNAKHSFPICDDVIEDSFLKSKTRTLCFAMTHVTHAFTEGPWLCGSFQTVLQKGSII